MSSTSKMYMNFKEESLSHHLRTLQSAFYRLPLHMALSLSALTGPNSCCALLMNLCHVESPPGNTRGQMTKGALFFLIITSASWCQTLVRMTAHLCKFITVKQRYWVWVKKKNSQLNCTAQQSNTVGNTVMLASSNNKKQKNTNG